MKRSVSHVGLLFLLIFTLSACYFDSGVVCDLPPPQPLFSVVSASSTVDDSIGAVTFSDFSLNGVAVEAGKVFSTDLTGGVGYGSNTVFEDGTIVCTLPCAFGFEAEEGNYGFNVSAEGYQTERINVDAKYQDLPPSQCGPSRGNLVELELELTPAE